jgi:hypothetical protein
MLILLLCKSFSLLETVLDFTLIPLHSMFDNLDIEILHLRLFDFEKRFEQ